MNCYLRKQNLINCSFNKNSNLNVFNEVALHNSENKCNNVMLKRSTKQKSKLSDMPVSIPGPSFNSKHNDDESRKYVV